MLRQCGEHPGKKKKTPISRNLSKLSGLGVKAQIKQEHGGWILSNLKSYWWATWARRSIWQTIPPCFDSVHKQRPLPCFISNQVHLARDKCSIEKRGVVNWLVIAFSREKTSRQILSRMHLPCNAYTYVEVICTIYISATICKCQSSRNLAEWNDTCREVVCSGFADIHTRWQIQPVTHINGTDHSYASIMMSSSSLVRWLPRFLGFPAH